MFFATPRGLIMNPWGRAEGGPGVEAPGAASAPSSAASSSSSSYQHSSVFVVPDYEALEASFQTSGPLLEDGGNIDALCHTYLGASHRPAEDLHELGTHHQQQMATANWKVKDSQPTNKDTTRRRRRNEGDTNRERNTNSGNTKVKASTRRGERGPKSWEFLVRLLAHENCNPTLIRWEDSEEATFLLVQPTIIAQMWGARCENPNLSYNNFARALRYHYNSGALEAVSERQFMYKCGPRALEYYRLLKEEKESSGRVEYLQEEQ
ncbi:ETS-related transcription factor Elf-4-like [Macrobrachium rosenbergii]|uniref:ETS-related transcription factor Elf-4-like n=1 Tax=Macrobrachium rosenbergii TaxID=79674 RepID=UPI0034D3B629